MKTETGPAGEDMRTSAWRCYLEREFIVKRIYSHFKYNTDYWNLSLTCFLTVGVWIMIIKKVVCVADETETNLSKDAKAPGRVIAWWSELSRLYKSQDQLWVSLGTGNCAFKERKENHYKLKRFKLSMVSLSPSFQSLEKRRKNIAHSTCWYFTGASLLVTIANMLILWDREAEKALAWGSEMGPVPAWPLSSWVALDMCLPSWLSAYLL